MTDDREVWTICALQTDQNGRTAWFPQEKISLQEYPEINDLLYLDDTDLLRIRWINPRNHSLGVVPVPPPSAGKRVTP